MLCAFFFRGGMTPDSASSSGICLNPFLCMSHLCRLSEQRHGKMMMTAAHSKTANTAKTTPVIIMFRLTGASCTVNCSSVLAMSCGGLGVEEAGGRGVDVCWDGREVEIGRLLEDPLRVVSLAVLRTSVERDGSTLPEELLLLLLVTAPTVSGSLMDSGTISCTEARRCRVKLNTVALAPPSTSTSPVSGSNPSACADTR